jgi:ABC-type antimicrobial peptide transport system permease subunit
MASAIDIVKKFIAIISVVLILFSVVAIIISSLMIGILTNVRVLERKKEIGIFRSLGASKLDIKTLFNIENIFIGIISLFISIFVIMIMVGPINKMMNNYMGLEDIFFIKYWLILIVFIINLVIIKISGSIPAIKASRMEIVNCIYNR